MKFTPSKILGVWQIELEPRTDDRGSFARTYCAAEFAQYGLHTSWPQGNLTKTLHRGTIRGLHWQDEPHPEIKLVRCSLGKIWDVVVDIRHNSPTFGQWEAFELDAVSGKQVYIPAGIAHGLQCLVDGSEVSYLMSEFYFPELARGLRWDDPDLGIPWPLANPFLSIRDQQFSRLKELPLSG